MIQVKVNVPKSFSKSTTKTVFLNVCVYAYQEPVLYLGIPFGKYMVYV